eukprot:1596570-Prymnesium_polylepis.2
MAQTAPQSVDDGGHEGNPVVSEYENGINQRQDQHLRNEPVKGIPRQADVQNALGHVLDGVSKAFRNPEKYAIDDVTAGLV